MKNWVILCIALVLLAAFFFFCMNGYTYISYSLLFVAFLLTVHHLGAPWIRRCVAVLTAIGLAYFCFVEYFIISNAFTDKDPRRSYLIVLGASVRNGEPSLALLHRLQGAYDYLVEFPEAKAVVSGGQGPDEAMPEAVCMRDWLVENGIAPERIIMEQRSTSTMENLTYSLELITADGGSRDDIAILSSNYHLYRAKLMAKSIGITAAGVRGRIGYPIYTLGMFIREAFGITHYRIFGR